MFRMKWKSGLALLLALLPLLATPSVAAEAAAQARLIALKQPDWPQFRGPRRDGICDERGLLPSWPEGGPKLLWSATNFGRGYSSPIISRGRMYLTGDTGEILQLYALDLNGRVLWRATNGVSWNGQYPGARASVTVSAGCIYHQNAHGRLA